MVCVVTAVGGCVEARAEVMIVRERRGILFFLVKRIEELVAVRAERRARWRCGRGMRRFIVLFSEAEARVYVSKMASCESVSC